MKRLSLLFVAVVLWGVGCGEDESAEAPSKPPVRVDPGPEMSGDDVGDTASDDSDTAVTDDADVAADVARNTISDELAAVFKDPSPKDFPALVKALGHPSKSVRDKALEAVRDFSIMKSNGEKDYIDLDMSAAVKPLCTMLRDKSKATEHRPYEPVGSIAAETLGYLKSADAVDPLLAVVQARQDNQIRWAAARALGAIGAERERITPVLAKMLKEVELGKGEVAGALLDLGAIDEVLPYLKHRDSGVRWEVAMAFEGFENAPPKVVKALAEALDDDEFSVRHTAAQALGSIEPKNAVAVPALVAALKRPPKPRGRFQVLDPAVFREAVVNALKEYGPEYPEVVPALTAALKDPEKDVREAAAEALASFPADSASALVGLLETWTEAVDYKRHGIGRRIAEDKANLERLLDIVADKSIDGPVRAAAVAVLARYEREDLRGRVDKVADAFSDKQAPLELRVRAGLLLHRLEQDPDGLAPVLLDGVSAKIDQEAREGCADVLGDLKVIEAIPVLIENLKPAPEGIGGKAAYALSSFKADAAPAIPQLIAMLRSEESNDVQAAAFALPRIGPPAREPAGPVLMDRLKNSENYNIRKDCADALVALAPETPGLVPAIVTALKNRDNSFDATSLADNLAKLGPRAKEALPLLAELAADEEAGFNGACLSAIGAIATDEVEVVPALIAATSSKFDHVRAKAVDVLGELALAPKQAVPALAELLENAPSLRPNALTALVAYGEAAAPAVPQISKLLSDAEQDTRTQAAQTLRRLGSTAASALPALRKRLEAEEQPQVQREIALTILMLSPADESLEGTLFTLFAEDRYRRQFTDALKESGAESIPLLLDALKDEAPEVRRAAFNVAVELENVSNATATLKEGLKDEDAEVRKLAALALTKGPVKSDARATILPVLVASIGDEVNHDWRIDDALRAFGPEAAPLLVARLFEDGVPLAVRMNLLEQLGRIGTGAAPAVPDLQARLESEPTDDGKLVAAIALAHVDPENAAAGPVLLSGLKHESALVRRKTLNALARIGESAKPAVPAIIAAAREEPDPSVTWNYGSAIRAIGLERDQIAALVSLLEDEQHRDWAASTIASAQEDALDVLPELLALLKNDDQGARRAATSALSSMGAPAVPQLVELATDDQAKKEHRLAALETISGMYRPGESAQERLAGLLDDEDETLRRQAVLAFVKCGGYDERILPTLLVGIQEQDYELNEALQSLGLRAKAAVPELIEMLKRRHRGMLMRDNANKASTLMRTLANIDPESQAARSEAISYVEALHGVYQDGFGRAVAESGNDHRSRTANDLAAFGPSIIPDLVEILDSPDDVLRRTAIRALSSIDDPEHTTVDALKTALSDDDPQVATHAASLLARHGEEHAEDVLPVLLDGLKSDERSVRQNAAAGIAALGPKAKDALPALMKLIDDDEIAYNVISAIGRIGPDAASAVPALIKAIPNYRNSYQAISALGEIGPAADATAPALMATLDDYRYRAGAAAALAQMGAEGQAAVPKLIGDLDNPYRRHATIRPLAEFAAVNDEARAKLHELAESAETVPDRRTAVTALGHNEQLAQKSLPLLLELLDDEQLAASAIQSIGAAGPEAAEAVPRLIEHLKEGDEQQRSAAVNALGRIGEPSAPAVPALINALDDDKLRYAVVKALGGIGPAANEGRSRLNELLEQTDDDYMRSAITEALKKINTEP